MAVQGGLLAAAITNNQDARFNKVLGSAAFLLAKLVAYTILGFALGWAGGKLQFSLVTQGVLQAAAAVYMLGVGLALLEVHPFFRYFILQPPRFLTRWMRGQAKSGAWFAPTVLGAATVLIPCGTTQAMMALTVASGKPVWGAAVMAAFVAGTSPVFLGLGVLMAKLGDAFKQGFLKYAGWAVVGMAVWSLNTAGVLLGSPISIQSALAKSECLISFCSGQVAGMASNRVTLEISRGGYAVSNAVRAGQDVEMTVVNTDGRGCQQAMTIPALGISKVVRPGQSQEISFKAPQKPGKLLISCSMGMYTGDLIVI